MQRRRRRIQRGIPDAIDLLVICVDAGLGIDQALLRVGQTVELRVWHKGIIRPVPVSITGRGADA